ncbi:hypothetical protein DIE15_19200 [Burkholderia sp. Bp9031]|nr:hypothetical protein DIE15_19200 [Burkholderia sp. Bp9031]
MLLRGETIVGSFSPACFRDLDVERLAPCLERCARSEVSCACQTPDDRRPVRGDGGKRPALTPSR